MSRAGYMGYNETPTIKGNLMSKAFNAFAQMNVDHYNNHPAKHTALTAALALGAAIVAPRIARRIVKDNPELRSGQYA